MKPRKPADLKSLQKRWDKVLKDSGFDDIEVTRAGVRELRQNAANSYRGAHPLEIQAKLDFFLSVSSMCQQTKFRNETERRIMDWYCDGKMKTEIVEELRRSGTKRSRVAVWKVIRKYLILFGLYERQISPKNDSDDKP